MFLSTLLLKDIFKGGIICNSLNEEILLCFPCIWGPPFSLYLQPCGKTGSGKRLARCLIELFLLLKNAEKLAVMREHKPLILALFILKAVVLFLCRPDISSIRTVIPPSCHVNWAGPMSKGEHLNGDRATRGLSWCVRSRSSKFCDWNSGWLSKSSRGGQFQLRLRCDGGGPNLLLLHHHHHQFFSGQKVPVLTTKTTRQVYSGVLWIRIIES